jgi:hypothetical protein
MNYGGVLRKDNPLIKDWVDAVNSTPDVPKKTKSDKATLFKSIIDLITKLIDKMGDVDSEEESEEQVK